MHNHVPSAPLVRAGHKAIGTEGWVLCMVKVWDWRGEKRLGKNHPAPSSHCCCLFQTPWVQGLPFTVQNRTAALCEVQSKAIVQSIVRLLYCFLATHTQSTAHCIFHLWAKAPVRVPNCSFIKYILCLFLAGGYPRKHCYLHKRIHCSNTYSECLPSL